ncbi:hypothetical protein VKT23_015520 [Stygiomarasmius scandens]|uniref:Uncharacterized protein n=1 Tax=Marasmiellus scandens TaxID=2682957 RepID=A0ABR1J1R6_9AGAR
MPGLDFRALAKYAHKIRHLGNRKDVKPDPPMGSTSSRGAPQVTTPSPNPDIKGDPEQKPASEGPGSSPNVDKSEEPDILDSLAGATSIMLRGLREVAQHAPKTHGNKGDLKSLAEDCVRVVSTVEVTCGELTKDNHPLPQDLINNLRELCDNLRSIENFAKKRAQRHFVKRFLLQDNDAGAIENYRAGLKHALDIFSLQSHITVREVCNRILTQIRQEHNPSTAQPIGPATGSPTATSPAQIAEITSSENKPAINAAVISSSLEPKANLVSEETIEPVRIGDSSAQKPRIEVVDVDRDIPSQSSPTPNAPMTEPQLKRPETPASSDPERISSPHNPGQRPVNPKKEDSSGSAKPTSDNSSSATTFFSGAHNFSMSEFRLNNVAGDQHNVENSDNRNVYHEGNSDRQRFSSPGGYNRPGPTRGYPPSRDSTWPDYSRADQYGGWTGGGPGNDFDRPGFDQRMTDNRYADYGRADTRGSYYGGPSWNR